MKNWQEQFRELYGDDFQGGFRDKLEHFIQTLLRYQKKEIVDSVPDEFYSEIGYLDMRSLKKSL
jgi:hypothetical protein